MTPTENFFISKKAFGLAVTAYATSGSFFFASSTPSAHGYFASLPGERGGGWGYASSPDILALSTDQASQPLSLSLALSRPSFKTFVSSCCGDEVGTGEGCLVWYRQKLCSCCIS
jgi:hypothetical protein